MKPGRYLLLVKKSKWRDYPEYKEIEVVEAITGYIKIKNLNGYINWVSDAEFDNTYDLAAVLSVNEEEEKEEKQPYILKCDYCGCSPNIIYRTNKGNLCEKCHGIG